MLEVTGAEIAPRPLDVVLIQRSFWHSPSFTKGTKIRARQICWSSYFYMPPQTGGDKLFL